MKETKQKIKKVVQDYKTLFPKEFEQFKKGVEQKQDARQGDFAEAKESDIVDRHLIDLPETLYYAIKQVLTQDEYDWFFANGRYSKDYSGMKWFMRNFKEFNVTKDF